MLLKATFPSSYLGLVEATCNLLYMVPSHVYQSAIFGYNPFTYTILKYCSTGDTQQLKNPENPEDQRQTKMTGSECLRI